jgi:predicted nucleotidyltransferase
MFRDCDYVKTKNNDFYIVKGYFQSKEYLYTTRVFEVGSTGNRLNANGLRYNKVCADVIVKLKKNEVMQVFRPEEAIIKHQLTDIWRDIYLTLLQMQIRDEWIGIIGSGLIGFPIIKDVDFILYGTTARNIFREKIDWFRKLGISSINTKHLSYHCQKYARNHNPKYSSWKSLINNKWSGLQVTENILTTVRFGYSKYTDVPRELIYRPINTGKIVEVTGEVIDANMTDYTPRVFRIRTPKNRQLWIKTLFWAFQSCVKTGQTVKVRGLADNEVVYLTSYDHGIIYGRR